MYFIFVLVNISNSHVKDIILSERFSFDKVYNFENSPLMAMLTPSYYQNHSTVMYYFLMVTDTTEAEL